MCRKWLNSRHEIVARDPGVLKEVLFLHFILHTGIDIYIKTNGNRVSINLKNLRIPPLGGGFKPSLCNI